VYGRILSTASEAALFFDPGQPNYSAAKAGIIAVTNSAAQALARFGVTANTFMPRARTAMTLTGPTAQFFQKPESGFDAFDPIHVTPLVCYLASPAAANISGNLFIVWGKEINVLGHPTKVGDFHAREAWTVEEVAKQVGGFFQGKQPIKDSFITPNNF
jgi:3-oxoacyl-[acyl-carrier protein] reductase